MLNDTERKLIRILFNRNRYENTRVSIPDLARFAQREVGQIRKALDRLQEERLIERSETLNFVRVVPGWEFHIK